MFLPIGVNYRHENPEVGNGTHSHGSDVRGNLRISYTVTIDHGSLIGDDGLTLDLIDSGTANDGQVATADGSGGTAWEDAPGADAIDDDQHLGASLTGDLFQSGHPLDLNHDQVIHDDLIVMNWGISLQTTRTVDNLVFTGQEITIGDEDLYLTKYNHYLVPDTAVAYRAIVMETNALDEVTDYTMGVTEKRNLSAASRYAFDFDPGGIKLVAGGVYVIGIVQTGGYAHANLPSGWSSEEADDPVTLPDIPANTDDMVRGLIYQYTNAATTWRPSDLIGATLVAETGGATRVEGHPRYQFHKTPSSAYTSPPNLKLQLEGTEVVTGDISNRPKVLNFSDDFAVPDVLGDIVSISLATGGGGNTEAVEYLARTTVDVSSAFAEITLTTALTDGYMLAFDVDSGTGNTATGRVLVPSTLLRAQPAFPAAPVDTTDVEDAYSSPITRVTLTSIITQGLSYISIWYKDDTHLWIIDSRQEMTGVALNGYPMSGGGPAAQSSGINPFHRIVVGDDVELDRNILSDSWTMANFQPISFTNIPIATFEYIDFTLRIAGEVEQVHRISRNTFRAIGFHNGTTFTEWLNTDNSVINGAIVPAYVVMGNGGSGNLREDLINPTMGRVEAHRGSGRGMVMIFFVSSGSDIAQLNIAVRHNSDVILTRMDIVLSEEA